MEKILPDPLPEIVFGSKESTISRAISKAVKAEQLKKLASRIYTSNLHDTEEEIVARNRYLILGKLFPGAVLSHRTALEGGTPTNGCIFITYKYTKNVLLGSVNK